MKITIQQFENARNLMSVLFDGEPSNYAIIGTVDSQGNYTGRFRLTGPDIDYIDLPGGGGRTTKDAAKRFLHTRARVKKQMRTESVTRCIRVYRSESGIIEIDPTAKSEPWDANAPGVDRLETLSGWGKWTALYRVWIDENEARLYAVSED